VSDQKLFISYRWTTPDHVDWVLNLATALRGDGIDVKLDQWDLKPGHDALKFMEEMVTDEAITKVLIVSDRSYAERANQRQGGVGIEAQIISKKVYESTKQEKFAAIVLELDDDGRPLLPTFLASRIFFDFSTDEAQAQNYEQIVRWVFDKPLNARPPIGRPPKYLEGESRPLISLHKPLSRVGLEGSSSSIAAAHTLLENVAAEAKSLIVNLIEESDQADKAYEAILRTTQTREQVYGAMRSLLRSNDAKRFDWTRSFFEELLRWWDYAPLNETYTRLDNDALRFFTHDCFVGFVALCLNEGLFAELAEFLSTPFYRAKHDGRTGDTIYYDVMRPYLDSLEIRNKQRNLNRLSLHADVLSETHESSLVPLDRFCEADFLLYIRGLLAPKYDWYPISGLYLSFSGGMVRIFARAESAGFYSRMSPLLFNKAPEELRQELQPYIAGQKKLIRFDYRAMPVGVLMNLDRLGTAA